MSEKLMFVVDDEIQVLKLYKKASDSCKIQVITDSIVTGRVDRSVPVSEIEFSKSM